MLPELLQKILSNSFKILLPHGFFMNPLETLEGILDGLASVKYGNEGTAFVTFTNGAKVTLRLQNSGEWKVI
jgi:hypothetical protein